MWVGRPCGMNLLFVIPEGIWIKEGLGRKDRPTLHPSGPGTHGCKWPHERWMVLHCTPQPGIHRPSWCPHIQMKGCHVSRDGNLLILRNGWGGGLLYLCTPQPQEWRGLRINTFRLLGGWFWHSSGGGYLTPPDKGSAIGMAEWDRVLCKSPYRSSASDPATANSTFCRPTASRCWASSCRRLAWHNKCRPWKEKRERERERFVTKDRHNHETAKRIVRMVKH